MYPTVRADLSGNPAQIVQPKLFHVLLPLCHVTSQLRRWRKTNCYALQAFHPLPTHPEPMPNTRQKNASQHPGDNKVPKRKRRTKQEMQIFRQQEAAAKAAKALKKQEAIDRVAALEKAIAEGDADMKTPRPHTNVQSPLSAITESSDGLGPVSDSLDEYVPSATGMDGTTDGADVTLSADEETPVKKKARTSTKASFRDAVKKVNEDPAPVKTINRSYASADLAGPRDNVVPKK
jgi:hypothetical protein